MIAKRLRRRERLIAGKRGNSLLEQIGWSRLLDSIHSVCITGFYEKVIKVKADVAAVFGLNCTAHSEWFWFSFFPYWNKHRFPRFLRKTDETGWSHPRCRASIRTLNGPPCGPVHVGVRFHAQVRHPSVGPGLLGCCHLTDDLKRTSRLLAVTRTRRWNVAYST
jgi:hypothetical protein